VESQPPHSKQTDVTLSRNSKSPLEGIADLLENLPTEACIGFTSRLLSTAASLRTDEARSQAFLKTVILFIAEYDCFAWKKRVKSLQLACWNTDSVRGRKLELDQFLSTAFIFASVRDAP
jgi:hypothetical protein